MIKNCSELGNLCLRFSFDSYRVYPELTDVFKQIKSLLEKDDGSL